MSLIDAPTVIPLTVYRADFESTTCNRLFLNDLQVVNSICALYTSSATTSTATKEEMMLTKKYIRDGKCQNIGSVTSGYTGAFEQIVKDEHEQVLGTTSEKFHTTRDGHGGIVSINSADPGLLINRKK